MMIAGWCRCPQRVLINASMATLGMACMMFCPPSTTLAGPCSGDDNASGDANQHAMSTAIMVMSRCFDKLGRRVPPRLATEKFLKSTHMITLLCPCAVLTDIIACSMSRAGCSLSLVAHQFVGMRDDGNDGDVVA